MTRYWALRSDQSRREFMWRELREGRLRQGWGYRADQDLELLSRLRHGANRLADHQRDAWRGNRRLLPTEPGAMQVGDLVVFLHLPRYGTWSIARVTGGYRYEISDMPNAVDGTPDYGHMRDCRVADGRCPHRPRWRRGLGRSSGGDAQSPAHVVDRPLGR